MSLQQERDLELRYALAKQVPDMERGFTIETSYGAIRISAEHAQKIIPTVRKLLEQQLKALKAQN